MSNYQKINEYKEEIINIEVVIECLQKDIQELKAKLEEEQKIKLTHGYVYQFQHVSGVYKRDLVVIRDKALVTFIHSDRTKEMYIYPLENAQACIDKKLWIVTARDFLGEEDPIEVEKRIEE